MRRERHIADLMPHKCSAVGLFGWASRRLCQPWDGQSDWRSRPRFFQEQARGTFTHPQHFPPTKKSLPPTFFHTLPPLPIPPYPISPPQKTTHQLFFPKHHQNPTYFSHPHPTPILHASGASASGAGPPGPGPPGRRPPAVRPLGAAPPARGLRPKTRRKGPCLPVSCRVSAATLKPASTRVSALFLGD